MEPKTWTLAKIIGLEKSDCNGGIPNTSTLRTKMCNQTFKKKNTCAGNCFFDIIHKSLLLKEDIVHKTIFHKLCEESLEDIAIGSKIIFFPSIFH